MLRMAHLGFGLLLLTATNLAYSTELATSTASYETLPLERWFDGTVESVKHVTISSETKGRVAEVMFDVGDRVPAGAVVIKLISNEQRDSLNQAEAKLAEARANLEVEKKENARLEELYKRSVISKSEWDRAAAKLSIFKSQVISSEALVKTAQEELTYTEVRSPYGGIVSTRHAERGEAVQPGSSLMSIFDPTAMRVVATLPQTLSEKVQTLKKARIKLDDNTIITPTKIIPYPMATPSTSTVKVRLELYDMPSFTLHPGEFVNVGFTVGTIKRLLIPSKSVVYRSEVTGVYVIKNNIPSLRQIRLGNQFGDKIEVLSGLENGEQVAIDPVAAGIALHALDQSKKHD